MNVLPRFNHIIAQPLVETKSQTAWNVMDFYLLTRSTICVSTVVSAIIDIYLRPSNTFAALFSFVFPQTGLFQPHNNDQSDHENHYHFLWHDLAATVFWFITSGIAMACGVGGGGIYVPLGMLLLQFAPKPASGLSQASIFGASLGGLLLNARFNHPFQKIRHDAALPPKEGDTLGLQRDISKGEQERYESTGGKLYTRPLIDFDMALFLSPMAMAGAVLGVLVQKVLPNCELRELFGCSLISTWIRMYLICLLICRALSSDCWACSESHKPQDLQKVLFGLRKGKENPRRNRQGRRKL